MNSPTGLIPRCGGARCSAWTPRLGSSNSSAPRSERPSVRRVPDEAARLSADQIAALRPMRARRPEARFAILSTAWNRTDPFWTAWASEDPSLLRLKATAEIAGLFSAEFLEQERCALGEHGFNREYLGIPIGANASPFQWELYERATKVRIALVAPGPAFSPPAETPLRIANPFQRLQASGAVR